MRLRGRRGLRHHRARRWCRALLARSVYPPPSSSRPAFPSLAHSPEHVERTLEAAAAAFAEVE